MGSATLQLIGNVATELKKSMETQGRERVSFRVIATERRRDPVTNVWTDGDEFAVSVICWGALARGVAQSIRLGDPVVVSGRLATRRYEVDNETKYITELKASQIGHDLSRGRASFQRASTSSEVIEAPESADATDGALEEVLSAPF